MKFYADSHLLSGETKKVFSNLKKKMNGNGFLTNMSLEKILFLNGYTSVRNFQD